MIRKLLCTGILAALFSAASYSQNPGFEKLNAYKIGFFTKKLNLTPDEAEKFWPVYNEMQEKKNEVQKERIMMNRTILQNSGTMSEKELIEAGDRLVSLQVEEADIAMEYHRKFREILPPVKVIRLYQAENQYRMQLLNELRQRKPGQRQPVPER